MSKGLTIECILLWGLLTLYVLFGYVLHATVLINMSFFHAIKSFSVLKWLVNWNGFERVWYFSFWTAHHLHFPFCCGVLEAIDFGFEKVDCLLYWFLNAFRGVDIEFRWERERNRKLVRGSYNPGIYRLLYNWTNYN